MFYAGLTVGFCGILNFLFCFSLNFEPWAEAMLLYLGRGTGSSNVWKLPVTWKCRLMHVTQYSSGLSPFQRGGMEAGTEG